VQIHTIGHSDHSLDEFMALLELYSIEQTGKLLAVPWLPEGCTMCIYPSWEDALPRR